MNRAVCRDVGNGFPQATQEEERARALRDGEVRS